MIWLVIGTGCRQPPTTSTTASASETGTPVDASGVPTADTSTSTGSDTSTGDTGTLPIDTGWPLDPSCEYPVDLPVEQVGGDQSWLDKGDTSHCNDLQMYLPESTAETDALLSSLLQYPDAFVGPLDWASQDGLLVVMPGCFKVYDYDFTGLRQCADGRVVMDVTHLTKGSDTFQEHWWMFALPASTWTGTISRVQQCVSPKGPCTRYLDGVEVP